MQNNADRLVRAEATDIVKLRVCHIENRCIVGSTVQIDIGHGRRLKKRALVSVVGRKNQNGKTPNGGDCGHQRNQLYF